MGIMAGVAAAGMAASLGSSIAGMADGPGSNGTFGGPAGIYMPQDQPQMDGWYSSIVGQQIPYAMHFPEQMIPQYQQAAGNITNNPYAGQAQGAANQVGGMGGGVGAAEMAGGGALFGAGAGALPYGGQILAQGFDPQNALYDRAAQQMMDFSGAINAQNGVGGTPYGAGVTGQNMANFSLDWADRALGREQTAASGYDSLMAGAGGSMAGGAGLASRGMETIAGTGALPYKTSIGMSKDSLGALDSLNAGASNSMAIPNSVLQNIAAYLNLGQGASQLGIQGQGQRFDQQQTLGANAGSALTQLGGAAGNADWSWLNSLVG